MKRFCRISGIAWVVVVACVFATAHAADAQPAMIPADTIAALETKLAEYGIEIPFPQRDLHLKTGFPKKI